MLTPVIGSALPASFEFWDDSNNDAVMVVYTCSASIAEFPSRCLTVMRNLTSFNGIPVHPIPPEWRVSIGMDLPTNIASVTSNTSQSVMTSSTTKLPSLPDNTPDFECFGSEAFQMTATIDAGNPKFFKPTTVITDEPCPTGTSTVDCLSYRKIDDTGGFVKITFPGKSQCVGGSQSDCYETIVDTSDNYQVRYFCPST